MTSTVTNDVRILTVRPPWSWAIIHAGKTIENRTRPCSFRGTLLIQASARIRSEDLKQFNQDCKWIAERFNLYVPRDERMQFGGIIGAVDMTGCTQSSDSPWFFGPFGWLLSNARPLPFTPHRGSLCLQRVSAELAEQLGLDITPRQSSF